MIDSMFVGVTGVRSHQTKMSVISNNVANINTTAYKGGRASFSDVMSRTLSQGGPARDTVAATNPMQSGLGVQVSSIDTMLQQGTLQLTGIETDLAVEGDGYFILGQDASRVYTRDGTFSFDVNGRLIDPGTGLIVQGNLADAGGKLKSELENLVIPLDRESEARATQGINLSGNLDASGSGEGDAVWNNATTFGQPARVISTPNPGFPLDLSSLSGGGLKVTVTEEGQTFQSTISVPAKSYAQRTDLVSELNSQISANGTLKNRVFFRTNELGQLILRTVDGGTNVSLAVDNANAAVNVASRLGLSTGTSQQGTRAADTDLINALADVGQDLTQGDVLRFTGIKPDGERFDGTFTYQTTTGDKLGNLFDAVENVYGGVQAGLDPETGEFILTDAASGDRVAGFEIQFSLLDSGNGSGIFGEEPPYEFSTNTQVYDQKGGSHSLTLSFTKGVVDNEWNWVATVDGLTPEAGNDGKVVFNEDGTLRSFESADRSPLRFTPGDGTPALTINLSADSSDILGGLTQFVADTSASIRGQDGRAAGNLVSVSIESTGSIVGLFSNGSSETLGRVSLASFSNEGGLLRQGSNLFSSTQASGQAVVGAAESTVQGSIRSGSIEMSNVDLAQEFTEMILAQRGFQASARAITTSDEL
ncbi:MAG: flagellar hook-basal body complex protein, partial [Candidatus Latescibacterota bacterium]